jgi:hypothetical protein
MSTRRVPASIEGAGTVAAPLLAGFSFTLVAFVLQLGPGHIRWPDLTLTLLVAAGLSLIGTVQSLLWSRAYEGTGRQSFWDAAGKATYDIGIILLLAAICTSLLPPKDPTPARLAAVLVAAAGFTVEVLWVVLSIAIQPSNRQKRTELRWLEAIDETQTQDNIQATLAGLVEKGFSSKKALKKSRVLGHAIRLEEVSSIKP